MPEEVSVEDIEQLHIDAWEMGLKAVAIYRDNCKVAQPLSMAKKEGAAATPAAAAEATAQPFIVKGAVRRELPKHRNAKTFAFTVAGSKGYVTVGEYEDGTPGEVFMKIAKQGSTLAGIMDSLAVSVSYGLQYGVPLKSYVHGLTNMSFAPSGITDDPDIRTASSLVDYIFRRLALSYLSFDDRLELGMADINDMPELQTTLIETTVETPEPAPTVQTEPIKQAKPGEATPAVNEAPAMPTADAKLTVGDAAAPLCYNCGNQTQRAGSCYVCSSCGSTTGCS
jgi:ribonucleoside-diphosphate reductase alpha chain